MSLIKDLNKEHSKDNTLKIVNYAKEDVERLNELMNISLKGKWHMVQRAACLVGLLAEKTKLIDPYIPQLIKNLKREVTHNAVKRNTVRVS